MRRFLLILLVVAAAWAQRGPILDAQRILVSGGAAEGDEARVSVVVLNRGDSVAYGIACTLSANGVEWGTLSKAQELAPGSQTTLEGTLKVPKGGVVPIASDGAARLDARLGQFFLPDLVIEKVELPEVVNRGEPADIRVTVRNEGKGPAGGLLVEVLKDGKPLDAHRTLGRLNEGAREVVSITWTPHTEGKVELMAVVDRKNRVDEQDEGNNASTVVAKVLAERSTLLRVSELTVESPREPRLGTPVRLRLAVTNSGDLDVYRVPVVLQVNGQEVQAKTNYVEIKPQSAAELYLRFTPTVPGKQTVTAILGPTGARVDPTGKNSASTTLEVAGRSGYHLKVTSMEAPSRVTLGKDYIVTATVKNTGDQAADVCKVALSANGAPIVTERSEKGLGPGQEARIKLRWSPSKLGVVRLGALASGTGAETGEEERPYEVEVRVEER